MVSDREGREAQGRPGDSTGPGSAAAQTSVPTILSATTVNVPSFLRGPSSTTSSQASSVGSILQSHSSATLYVGDLHPDITENTLNEIFSPLGPVRSIRVCRDVVTRRSLGYAYVNFVKQKDAENALKTMNYHSSSLTKDKPMRLMWKIRDPSARKSGAGNIFVKNLDDSVDNRTLFEAFSEFGNILSYKVAMSDAGKSLGYGFVHYEREDDAISAIAGADGSILSGRQIQVGKFLNKRERVEAGQSTRSFTNVYVKNLDDSFCSEDRVCDLFSSYGKITSLHVPSDDNGNPRGFAFVNFENPEMAHRCVTEMHGKEIEGKVLCVCRAQTRQERESELRTKNEKHRIEMMQKYQGVNLYVKNLSDEIDDERLQKEFGVFGTITSCKVMRDDKNNSRGFGFVCFTQPEEATKAVTELNGRIVGQKPLFVALAQRKDVRKAYLEARHGSRSQTTDIDAESLPGPGSLFGPFSNQNAHRMTQPRHSSRLESHFPYSSNARTRENRDSRFSAVPDQQVKINQSHNLDQSMIQHYRDPAPVTAVSPAPSAQPNVSAPESRSPNVRPSMFQRYNASPPVVPIPSIPPVEPAPTASDFQVSSNVSQSSVHLYDDSRSVMLAPSAPSSEHMTSASSFNPSSSMSQIMEQSYAGSASMTSTPPAPSIVPKSSLPELNSFPSTTHSMFKPAPPAENKAPASEFNPFSSMGQNTFERIRESDPMMAAPQTSAAESGASASKFNQIQNMVQNGVQRYGESTTVMPPAPEIPAQPTPPADYKASLLQFNTSDSTGQSMNSHYRISAPMMNASSAPLAGPKVSGSELYRMTEMNGSMNQHFSDSMTLSLPVLPAEPERLQMELGISSNNGRTVRQGNGESKIELSALPSKLRIPTQEFNPPPITDNGFLQRYNGSFPQSSTSMPLPAQSVASTTGFIANQHQNVDQGATENYRRSAPLPTATSSPLSLPVEQKASGTEFDHHPNMTSHRFSDSAPAMSVSPTLQAEHKSPPNFGASNTGQHMINGYNNAAPAMSTPSVLQTQHQTSTPNFEASSNLGRNMINRYDNTTTTMPAPSVPQANRTTTIPNFEAPSNQGQNIVDRSRDTSPSMPILSVSQAQYQTSTPNFETSSNLRQSMINRNSYTSSAMSAHSAPQVNHTSTMPSFAAASNMGQRMINGYKDTAPSMSAPSESQEQYQTSTPNFETSSNLEHNMINRYGNTATAMPAPSAPQANHTSTVPNFEASSNMGQCKVNGYKDSAPSMSAPSESQEQYQTSTPKIETSSNLRQSMNNRNGYTSPVMPAPSVPRGNRETSTPSFAASTNMRQYNSNNNGDAASAMSAPTALQVDNETNALNMGPSDYGDTAPEIPAPTAPQSNNKLSEANYEMSTNMDRGMNKQYGDKASAMSDPPTSQVEHKMSVSNGGSNNFKRYRDTIPIKTITPTSQVDYMTSASSMGPGDYGETDPAISTPSVPQENHKTSAANIEKTTNMDQSTIKRYGDSALAMSNPSAHQKEHKNYASKYKESSYMGQSMPKRYGDSAATKNDSSVPHGDPNIPAPQHAHRSYGPGEYSQSPTVFQSNYEHPRAGERFPERDFSAMRKEIMRERSSRPAYGTPVYNEAWNRRNTASAPRPIKFGTMSTEPGPSSSYERTIVRRAVVVPPTPQSPVEISSNDEASQERQILGEMLYRRISERQPTLAAKITAMLLQMGTTPILRLLDSPEALADRVKEAMIALREHAASSSNVIGKENKT